MSKQLVRFYSIFLILTILLTQFGIRPAAADATFNVNSSADIVDANLEDGLCATDVPVVCTLRAAIQQANALGGADTISIPADVYTLTIEGADEDAAVTGDLDIIGDLTITGAGATVTVLDPNDLDRALHVVSGSLTLSDLKVQNGTANPGGALKVDSNAIINRAAFVNNESPSTSSDGTGGGIYVANSGSAVISESSFSGNLANYGGGAVASSTSAVFTITDSTFDGNFGGFGGGALYPNGRANSVSNSTFTNNNADTGGAIHSNAASVTVTNSTFVGNSANNHGAIDSRVGQITVQYSTFYNNSAGRYGDSIGSQAYGAGGTLSVGNSILYGTSFDNCDTTDGFVTDLGNNLSWPSDNNCPGTRADPLLDTNLANNGGPTQTLALLPGSPALNAGIVQTCPDTDQRGETRPQGAGCDIGAYEAKVVNIFRVTNTNDSGSGSLRQAILNANATLNSAGGSDQIRFAIRAEGVQTISPLTELPLLSEGVVIDGYTQPGSSPNTLALGNNANIQIELNGDICGCARGLWISVGSTVKGLAIRGGFNNGIEVNGSGSTITGNFISVGPDDPPEGVIISGIYLNNTSNNTVGGSAPAERNVIALNAGTGVSVDSGTGNIIRGNNIFSNDSLGIDLAHDEVTFNHAFDPEFSISGPNNYQNYPVLSLATSDGETLRVGGFLESEPNQDYTIDIFANATCDPLFFGEGESYIGSFTVSTDEDGLVIFDTNDPEFGNLPVGAPEPHGISATATGSSGTSEFSYCRPVATPNLNWVQAQSVSGESQTQQYITDIFQEKWFKFPVQPGSTVSIKLTSLPGSAVSLHRDPNPIYKELTNPQNAELLSAEAADAAFLPSGSLPSGSLPSGSLPSGSLPSGSLPSGSLPTGYLPSGSLPSGSLPSGSLPSGSLPSGSLPSGSLPSGSLPSGSLPSGSLPSGSLPSGSLPSGSLPSGSLPSGSLPSGSLPSGSLDAYASAAVNSLMGISMDPYATVQTIERNTYDLQENLYVRIVGPYNLETPFTLDVMVESGVCVGIDPMPDTDDLPVISGSPLSSGSYQTLILTDSARLHGEPGEITAALDDLDTLAARSDVNGILIDLNDSKYLRVDLANTQADTHLACAAAKNTVAKEIKKVIDAYRAANPTLEYIVLAGGADVIPFFQVQDVSGLANEKDYVPPVLPSTASEAGLKTNLVQGQDAYGSQIEFTQAGYTLALPDLAVGRLVDSATEISATVDAYIATDGVIAPNSSLVTGYDFVGDAAVAIKAEMDAGTDSIADTLIQAPGLPPTDASAWTANQLRTKLLGGNFDIAVLTGHFSAGNLLAADYATELSAAEIESMTDVLVLALGCHGGYSIPNSDLLTDISPNPDWARAFLANGAAGYVSATGYAYGDTELVEYGERLFLRLAQQLRTGSGPVSVGQALVKAKQQFLAETAQLTGIDQKTLVEMTLYGLPMMKVDMPGVRLNPPTENSIVSGTSPVLVGPGASFGLRSSPVVLNPVVNTHTKILQNLSGGGTVTTTHLSGADGVVVNPFEPIYPKEIFNVTSNGNVLRGVALRGGIYSDLSGIIPLTSSPTTETSTAHLSFNTDVFYPTQTWASNFSDAINGGNTRLIVFPAQFKSSAPSAIDGILRKFNHLDLQFYYLPDNWTDVGSSPTTKAAAVSAAPVILGASGVEDGNTVKFSVNAAAEGSAGVQAVWVLYTGKTGSSYYGMWAPLDLTQNPNDPTLWEGTLTLQSGENAEDILFMVQSVGGAGLTTLATNLGAYYSVADENATQLPLPAATTLTLQSPPANGTYLKQSSFDLLLQADGQHLAGRLVTLDIGGQQASGITNSAGEVTLTLNLVVRPGNYTAQASFRGNAEYLGSNDASAFTVHKDSTTLTVTPASASVMTSQPTPFVAVVRDSSGRALGGKSVFFIVHNSTDTFATSVIADFQGNAALGVVPLPAGVYTVDAYFNGTIPVSPSITLSDDYYESSSRLGLSLELKSFAFTGFFDPVKNPPIMNQMNAGRAVPLKFSLGGDQGLAVFASGFPQSQRIQCDSLSLVDNVEQTTIAGSSFLSYDPATGTYTYVWKTEKSWAGTCRQVTVQFIDGQTYTLNFKFVR